MDHLKILQLKAECKSLREIVSIAHGLNVSKELKDTVNQVSTSKTPSLPLNGSVNPSGIASGKLSDRKKRVFQEVVSEVDSLAEEIVGRVT